MMTQDQNPACELARRDERFRVECKNQTGQLKHDYEHRRGHDRLNYCPDCNGLGYLPLSGAALLLACVEWCGTLWELDIWSNDEGYFVRVGDITCCHQCMAGPCATATEAAAAAVFAAMEESRNDAIWW